MSHGEGERTGPALEATMLVGERSLAALEPDPEDPLVGRKLRHFEVTRLLGLPLEEAARMAATYPADFLGLGATHGRIAPSYHADLVALDADLQLKATWIGGSYQTH